MTAATPNVAKARPSIHVLSAGTGERRTLDASSEPVRGACAERIGWIKTEAGRSSAAQRSESSRAEKATTAPQRCVWMLTVLHGSVYEATLPAD